MSNVNSKKNAADTEVTVDTESVPAAEATESTPAKKPSGKPAKTPLKAKDVDLNQYVTVRNGFQGMLIYVSKRTGEVFEWDEFGAEQEMELGELKNAKNSNKKFFINNWFMFDDPWIIDFLGVRQFYKNTIPIDQFDEIFQKDAGEVAKIIRKIPEGQKRSVAYRAKQLIAENAIDSMSLVSVLEKELGVDLIEKSDR